MMAHLPKTITLPHNSVLFSNSEHHHEIGNHENHSHVRQHRQSSRYSFYHHGHNHHRIRYENTYRMEPNNEHKLDLVQIRRVATSIIEAAILNYEYNPEQATKFIELLAEQIRSRMKQLHFPRYKIITQASIGQNKGQDLRMVSKCIWNSKWDRHITITKETFNDFITVTIFFIYTE
ncbi:unnamed protein product [Adineta steineri]|uniref:Uncharacterized protein n=1 Tax=Adineta steineri TaxID=433720 RepID=A0A818GGW4_9BILA|nr:unnamed protein product [Adineta steineri]